MADVQLENGYTEIADELIEAIVRLQVSGPAHRLIWWVFRQTYGWKQSSFWTTMGELAEDLALHRNTTARAVDLLDDYGVIKVTSRRQGRRASFEIYIVKDYEKWTAPLRRGKAMHHDRAIDRRPNRRRPALLKVIHKVIHNSTAEAPGPKAPQLAMHLPEGITSTYPGALNGRNAPKEVHWDALTPCRPAPSSVPREILRKRDKEKDRSAIEIGTPGALSGPLLEPLGKALAQHPAFSAGDASPLLSATQATRARVSSEWYLFTVRAILAHTLENGKHARIDRPIGWLTTAMANRLTKALEDRLELASARRRDPGRLEPARP